MKSYFYTLIYNNKKIFLLLILSFASIQKGYANEKDTLEKQKEAIIKKIKELQQMLTETSKEQKNNIYYLQAINEQIVNNEKYINLLNKNLETLYRDIIHNKKQIQICNQQLIQLKKDYSYLIHEKIKQWHLLNYFLFIIFIESFYEGIQKMQYLKEYTILRKNQLKKMMDIKKKKLSYLNEVHQQTVQKEKILIQKQKETYHLMSLQKEKYVVISNLEKKQISLYQTLQKEKQAAKELERKIQDLITEELTIKEEIETKTPSENQLNLSIKAVSLSNRFKANHGKLDWPVKGFVTKKFGINQHPILKDITEESLGITIQCNKEEQIRAVFEGSVKQIYKIPSLYQIIILQHGEYLTVYTNLKKITVNIGDKIEAGELLGYVATNQEGITEIQFQIWKKTQKLNPLTWLKN